MTRGPLALLSSAAALRCALALAGCGSGDDSSAEFGPVDGAAAEASKLPEANLSESTPADASPRAGDGGAATDGDATVPSTTGPVSSSGGVFQYDPSPIDWPAVGCGATVTKTFGVTNAGTGKLNVLATTTSTAFQLVAPTGLSLNPGERGGFSITVSPPGDAPPGKTYTGTLNLFTTDTDPTKANVVIKLSATPSGAQLSLGQLGTTPSLDFGTSRVGMPAPAQPLTLQNTGNASAAFEIGTPSDRQFSLSDVPDGGTSVTLQANEARTITAHFTPADGGAIAADLRVGAPTGVVCGTANQTIHLTGKGTLGTVSGPYPTALTFSANCGGQPPPAQTITLKNTGTADVTVTSAQFDSPEKGFTVSPTTGIIPAGDGGAGLVLTVSAPPYLSQVDSGTADGGPPPSIAANLRITQMGDPQTANPIVVPVTENPVGAILNFDTSNLPFSSVVVHGRQAQAFNVVNSGSGGAAGSATVSLNVVPLATGDGGAVGTTGGPPPFTVDTPQFTVTVQGKQQSENVTFAPVAAGAASAQIVMRVDPSTVLCAPLPQPLTVQGTGSGLSVGSPDITLYAPCDGVTNPGGVAFALTNTTDASVTWAVGDRGITGPGAAFYRVVNVVSPDGKVDSMQGRLRSLGPSQSASINVGGTRPMPSAASKDGGTATNDAGMPWTAPQPADLAALLTIAAQFGDGTNAGPVVVSLHEIPVGDQISASVGGVPITNVPFGSVPIAGAAPATRTLLVTNNANAVPASLLPGYPGASLSIASTNPVFTPSPASFSLLAGASAPVSVAFAPTTTMLQRAALTLLRTNPTAPLCAPLPPPIALSGTGSN